MPQPRTAAPKTLPKTFTKEEIDVLRAAPNLAVPTGLRDRCVIELMLGCGLRVSEVCGLHLRDVDWRAGEIRLRPEITKGQREAVVYPSESALALLERWKDARRPFGSKSPYLFVCVRQADRGHPLSRRGVHKMIARRCAKHGIAGWPHKLRHTFATELLGDGLNLREVQTAMRHADVRTTVIYTHVRNEDLKAKLRRRA